MERRGFLGHLAALVAAPVVAKSIPGAGPVVTGVDRAVGESHLTAVTIERGMDGSLEVVDEVRYALDFAGALKEAYPPRSFEVFERSSFHGSRGRT